MACDQFFSPIEYNNVVEVILYLLQGRISGVFNLGSGEQGYRNSSQDLYVRAVYENTTLGKIQFFVDDFRYNYY